MMHFIARRWFIAKVMCTYVPPGGDWGLSKVGIVGYFDYPSVVNLPDVSTAISTWNASSTYPCRPAGNRTWFQGLSGIFLRTKWFSTFRDPTHTVNVWPLTSTHQVIIHIEDKCSFWAVADHEMARQNDPNYNNTNTMLSALPESDAPTGGCEAAPGVTNGSPGSADVSGMLFSCTGWICWLDEAPGLEASVATMCNPEIGAIVA